MIQAEIFLVVEEKDLLEQYENCPADPETTRSCYDGKIDIAVSARDPFGKLAGKHNGLHEGEKTDETPDECCNAKTPPGESLFAQTGLNARIGRGPKEVEPSAGFHDAIEGARAHQEAESLFRQSTGREERKDLLNCQGVIEHVEIQKYSEHTLFIRQKPMNESS